MQIKKGRVRGGRVRPYRSNRALKSVRNIVVAFFGILVVLVGAALLYVWLGTTEAPATSLADPVTTGRLDEEKKTGELDPNSPVGVSVQTLTSPAMPGTNVSLIARTRPGATCSIVVEYDGEASTDSGLHDKEADNYGTVQWSWALEDTTPTGEWPIEIKCSEDEKSGVVNDKLVVGEEEES